MRYHFTPTVMAIIKKVIMTSISEDVKKLEPSYTTGGTFTKELSPLWKTVWHFLKMLNVELPYDPVIPLLGIYTQEK